MAPFVAASKDPSVEPHLGQHSSARQRTRDSRHANERVQTTWARPSGVRKRILTRGQPAKDPHIVCLWRDVTWDDRRHGRDPAGCAVRARVLSWLVSRRWKPRRCSRRSQHRQQIYGNGSRRSRHSGSQPPSGWAHATVLFKAEGAVRAECRIGPGRPGRWCARRAAAALRPRDVPLLERASPPFSSFCLSPVQILRSLRPPRDPTSGPDNQNHPSGEHASPRP